MNPTSTRIDILRAIHEGAAFSLAECLNTLRITGPVVVSGDGFHSDLLCEVLADVTAQWVLQQSAPETSAHGTAVFTLVLAGVSPDIFSAPSALGTTFKTFGPNPDNIHTYLQAWVALYDACKRARRCWHTLRKFHSSTGKVGLENAEAEETGSGNAEVEETGLGNVKPRKAES